MKTKDQKDRLASDKAYADDMVEGLKQVPREKKPVSSVQCESTRKLLAMSDEEHSLYMQRPWPPDGWKAQHPSEVEKNISFDELIIVDGLRSQSKNTLGQSDKSSASDDRKHLAAEAFTYSHPAPLTEVQKEKLTKIEPITEFKELPKTTKPSFIERIKNLFKAQLPPPKSFAEKSPELVEQFQIKEKK